MSRVTDILTNSRRILSDKNATRWSNDELISLLNEGLQSFILQAETLKLRAYIIIEDGITYYDMSSYSYTIKRVLYNNKPLTVKTHKQMDDFETNWLDTTGTEPTIVIFDSLKSGTFKSYPICDSGYANVVTANSPYGALIDISIVDDLLQAPVAEDIEIDISKYFLVYYIGKPRTITIDTVDGDFDLDSKYDKAMISYIVGELLTSDNDALSAELGTKNMNLFLGYVAKAKVDESANNNTFESYITEYRRF